MAAKAKTAAPAAAPVTDPADLVGGNQTPVAETAPGAPEDSAAPVTRLIVDGFIYAGDVAGKSVTTELKLPVGKELALRDLVTESLTPITVVTVTKDGFTFKVS